MDNKNNSSSSDKLKYSAMDIESLSGANNRSTASQSRINDLRILVVDDDSVMQEIITTIIAGIGITSYEHASNGFQALECLDNDNQSFDVIVCDLEIVFCYFRIIRIRNYQIN